MDIRDDPVAERRARVARDGPYGHAWINSSQIALLSSVGIWFNILGALLLAKAYAAAPDRALAFQARSYFDIAPPVLKALCEQRIDAKSGLLFLFCGFFAELLSSLGVAIDVTLALVFGFFIPIPILIAYNTNRYFCIMTDYVRIADEMAPRGALLPNENTRQTNFPDVPAEALSKALMRLRSTSS